MVCMCIKLSDYLKLKILYTHVLLAVFRIVVRAGREFNQDCIFQDTKTDSRGFLSVTFCLTN